MIWCVKWAGPQIFCISQSNLSIKKKLKATSTAVHEPQHLSSFFSFIFVLLLPNHLVHFFSKISILYNLPFVYNELLLFSFPISLSYLPNYLTEVVLPLNQNPVHWGVLIWTRVTAMKMSIMSTFLKFIMNGYSTEANTPKENYPS